MSLGNGHQLVAASPSGHKPALAVEPHRPPPLRWGPYGSSASKPRARARARRERRNSPLALRPHLVPPGAPEPPGRSTARVALRRRRRVLIAAFRPRRATPGRRLPVLSRQQGRPIWQAPGAPARRFPCRLALVGEAVDPARGFENPQQFQPAAVDRRGACALPLHRSLDPLTVSCEHMYDKARHLPPVSVRHAAEVNLRVRAEASPQGNA